MKSKKQLLFHFSSVEHPGCHITHDAGSGIKISDLEITSVQNWWKVLEENDSIWEKDGPRTYGTIFSRDLCELSFMAEQTEPISIEVFAFCAPENRDYSFKIEDIWITDFEDGELNFSAVKIIPWKSISRFATVFPLNTKEKAKPYGSLAI